MDELTTRLVDELGRRWADGERIAAEELLRQYPELNENPEAAIRVIYEEVCLRQERGDSVSEAEMYARFPQWRAQLKVVLDCHRLLAGPTPPTLPAAEETLGDYILLTELGRGLQGRVYLASQPTLAERLVVLKITPRCGQEHLALARLQHTHIMPLYAVHDDPKRNLRSLCMPYLGGAALHQVLQELAGIPVSRRTGKDLLAALDHVSQGGSEPERQHKAWFDDETLRWRSGSDSRSPIRQLYAGLSYGQAVCWIGACLADALQYAHERGLVHLDLKPSNVLLAADGQPLLLDFHIAQKPLLPGEPSPDGLGGTPAYMSPEQQAALTAIHDGQPIAAGVDGRSDIYSLGLLLYECLGGTIPLKENAPIPPLERCNPQVSVGLSDIIGKCLETDPQNRYPTAAALATDLRQHLRDLPLRGVRNRSWTERWRKWRRRRPHLLTLAITGLCVVTALLSMSFFSADHALQQRSAAESALTEGQQQIKNRAYAQAVDTLTRGVALADNALIGSGDLTDRLQAELHAARRALAAEQLHALTNRLRFLYGGASLPAGEVQTLADRWRQVWNKRTWLKDASNAKLEPELEQRLDTDLLDLGVIWADLCVRLAKPTALKEAHQEALHVLADTEALFGDNHLLWRQRAVSAQALSQQELAETARHRAAALKPQSAWEHYALGRALLQAGELEQAAAALDQAVVLQPERFWSHFYQGICAYRQKHYENALSAFNVCIALEPTNAECYYNRALAETALKRSDQALRDYDRALQLDPQLAAAALNRGLLHFEHQRHAEALADLQYAQAHGEESAVTHFNLALVYRAQHNRLAAIASLERTLQAQPGHKAARNLLDQLRRK